MRRPPRQHKVSLQCYAPDAMKEAELIAKVDEDLQGAQAHWNAELEEWIFVHNDRRGLPPNAVQHIGGLRRVHSPLVIEIWSEPELLKMAMGLNLGALQVLFGPAASISIVDRLVLADLVPIIEALQRQDPNAGDPPLTPPSPEKLKKNALSEESGFLLRMGRRKSALVETFFRRSPQPDLGERIAEAFRTRYAELKAFDLPADTIFKHLQDYAGMNGEPKRQGAALAVLTYFFDSCDIFEDPAASSEAS